MEKMDPQVQLQPQQFWESSAPGGDAGGSLKLGVIVLGPKTNLPQI